MNSPTVSKYTSTSFRTIPELIDPVREVARKQRRSLNGQLVVCIENYLDAADCFNQLKPELPATDSNNVHDDKPITLRVTKKIYFQAKRAAQFSNTPLSAWINHALHYCLVNETLEPQ